MTPSHLIMSLLFLFYGCAKNALTEAPPSTLQFGTDETLDIITWNIENFPQSNLTVEYLSQLIIELDADIVALQEIESKSEFDILVNSLDGWMGFKSNSASYNLNLAFIYNSTIINFINEYEIFQDDWYAFPRPPLILEVEWDDKQVYIINNHFKAMSGSENEDRRRDACTKLENYIATYLANDKVIVLGDLNDEIQEPQNSNVFWTFINDDENYKFADTNIANGSSTSWSYPTWPSHLDHILITNELYNNHDTTCTILAENYFSGWAEYESIISDHRPVGIRLTFGE